MTSPLTAVDLGLRACQSGNWLNALRLYRQALKQQPRNLRALHGLGVVCIQLQQPRRAVILLERAWAISHQPNPSLKQALVHALTSAAGECALGKHWHRARAFNLRALELEPNQTNSLSNLAVAEMRSNHLKEALKWSRQAITLEPNNPQALNNHGTILQETGALAEADALYQRVLQLNPEHPNALANRGCIAHQQARLNDAKKLYRKHLHAFPDDERVWVNLAGVLLMQENWNEGWKAYEKRNKNAAAIMNVPPGIQRWKGPGHKASHLIVVHEQGLGDSFQFVRYLPATRSHAQRVSYSGPTKLHELFQHSGLIEHCVDPEQSDAAMSSPTLRDVDAWVPLLSLPSLLTPSGEPAQANQPYLLASSQRSKQWKQILKPKNQPVVALHWQGNPEHEVTLSKGRSIPLQILTPLLNFNHLDWISLQKGPGSEQIDALELRQRFHSSQKKVEACWDFEETAAILMNCDLVITSDSGLAHLAAGLGRPTWLLLMKVPEWRWGLHGNRTSWYPTMRLFRQKQIGDWKGVVTEQLLPALRDWKPTKSS